MTWLLHQNVVVLAFLAGLFTWGCTIVGSAIVFFFKNISNIKWTFFINFQLCSGHCNRRVNIHHIKKVV